MTRLARWWLLALFACILAPPLQAQEANEEEPYRSTAMRDYTKAQWTVAKREARALRRSCDSGDQPACTALGEAYMTGHGVGQISAISDLLWREACEAGFGQACFELAMSRSGRGGGDVDFDEAAQLFGRACELETLDACREFASLLTVNDYTPEEMAEARRVVSDACDRDNAPSCIFLADIMLKNAADAEQEARALHLLDTHCRKGAAEACRNLVILAEREADRDEYRIGEYLYLECMAGAAYPCELAGTRLYRGIGFPRDEALALTLFGRACTLDGDRCEGTEAALRTPGLEAKCAAGSVADCDILGLTLSQTSSPLADHARAEELLAAACRAGRTAYCAKAGLVSLDRLDRSDPAAASETLAFLEEGCRQSDRDACIRLADELTQEGIGEPDRVRQGTIYAQLCEAGDKVSCALAQDFAGLVPGIAIGEAGATFVPPDGITEEQAAALMAERRAALAIDECVEYSERFRGQTYRSRICPPVEATIGGYRLRPGQAPWQALLWRPPVLNGTRLSASQRVQCGGSLVATGWILTAAHCLDDYGDIKAKGHRIRLGVYNPRANEGMSYPILRTVAHPGFVTRNGRKNWAFDIALIKYDTRRGEKLGPVNSIRTIALDPLSIGRRKVDRSVNVYSYGWGFTSLGSGTTDYLQGVKMQLRTEAECRKVTKYRTRALAHAVLCAGGSNNEATCFGDSGGPLVHYSSRPTIVGVVSGGKSCGTTGIPSRYPRVAKVRQWIDETID